MGRFPFILSLLNVVVNFDCQRDGAENHHGNTTLTVSRESHIRREDTPWKWTVPSERLGSWEKHKAEKELSPSIHLSLLPDCTWHMISGFKSPGSCLPHHCALCGQTVSPKRPALPYAAFVRVVCGQGGQWLVLWTFSSGIDLNFIFKCFPCIQRKDRSKLLF